jgi:tRNA (guanine37-N1)-methyltransferase
MKITVLSLFPEILRGFFESSLMAKACERGLMSYELVDVRSYATDKHRKCDDEVFGGGAGMLMLPGPLGRALASAGSPGKRTVYLTPSGRLLNQAMAAELSREAELVLVCGRYEGVDQRVIDRYVTDEISIGDYVLSSGEVAALVLVDAIYRLVPGVISGESLLEESFAIVAGGDDRSGSPKGDPHRPSLAGDDGSGSAVGDLHGVGRDDDGGSSQGARLLEYPQYTRPATYDNMQVPEVLTSGNHAKIARWRLRESLRKTLIYRPELLASDGLPGEVRKLIREIVTEGGDDELDTEDSSSADQGRGDRL